MVPGVKPVGDLPASSAAEEPTLVGVLATPAGTPLAGRQIRMYAWPSEAELEAMPDGATVDIRLVGTTESGADGKFTLTQSGTPVTAGVHDVTVVASDASGVLSTVDTSMEAVGGAGTLEAIPRLHEAAPAEAVTVAGTAAASPLSTSSMRLSASTPPPQVRTTKAGIPFVTLQAPASGSSISRLAGARSTRTSTGGTVGTAAACSTGLRVELLSRHRNRLTAVGSIHATTNGHRTRFLLSNGSSSSLGTALKMGSSWSASGSISRTLKSETRWGERTGAVNRILQTRYTVGHYKYTLGEYGVCSVYYKKKPISHEGGAESNTTGAATANYCRNYEKGGGMTLVKNKATNWTNGLSMASIIGFDVSSSAGYSSDERLDVDITATGRKICGSNKYPAEFPSRLVVKKR